MTISVANRPTLSGPRRFNPAQRIIVPLIFLIFLGCGSEQGSFKFPDCNIVLISIDTLRADRLSLYGYARTTSPSSESLERKRSSSIGSSTAEGGHFPHI